MEIMWDRRFRLSILFIFAVVAPAQPPANDPDKAIAGLRQIATDLNDAVKRFQSHLDREIAAHDRGYRGKDGQRIPGADIGLIGGPADVVQSAMRKLFAARMIASRRPGYAPAALADSDRIQALIAEARARIGAGTDVMRRLLVVSARDMNPLSDARQRMRRRELLKARTAATEAAERALVALPVPLPEADSPEEQRDKAWDLMSAKVTKVETPPTPQAETPRERSSKDAAVLPIRFDEGKRITLVNEHYCRMTLTDSGLEDRQGRHLFYQEEWMRRQGSLARTTGTGDPSIVVLMRWAVAVNTRTGQHTLLRRYEIREFRGDFEDLYRIQRSDYVSPRELPERSVPPSPQELASGVQSLDRSREDLHRAVLDFKRRIHEALARNDDLLDGRNAMALDDDLPRELRENLFLIRARLASTVAIQDAENRVRDAVEQAAAAARKLEALVAWINGNALEPEAPSSNSRPLMDALNRADVGITQTRSLEVEALAALPPDVSSSEAQFPALGKNLIVRIRRQSASGGIVRCRQEVWRLAASVRGVRQVKRTIVFIDLDPHAGSQVPTDREVKYYPIDPGESLEEIYDENAAQ